MRELIINGEKVGYELEHSENDVIVIKLNGKSYSFKTWNKSSVNELKRVEVDGRNINIWKSGDWVSFGETLMSAKSSRSEGRNKSGPGDHGGMLSPMPGKILKIMVNAGDKVAKGQGLLVMEAMKMEHTIKADADGIVDCIHCEEGGLVDGGVELVSLTQDTQ